MRRYALVLHAIPSRTKPGARRHDATTRGWNGRTPAQPSNGRDDGERRAPSAGCSGGPREAVPRPHDEQVRRLDRTPSAHADRGARPLDGDGAQGWVSRARLVR